MNNKESKKIQYKGWSHYPYQEVRSKIKRQMENDIQDAYGIDIRLD